MPSSQLKKPANAGTPASFHIRKEVVNAKPRQLSAKWSIDTREAMKLNGWDLSDDIKESIERDMLLKVIDNADDVISDCYDALESDLLKQWLGVNELTDRDYIEPVRRSFQLLAEACEQMSEQDEFTLTMAGVTEWPQYKKQVSQQAEKLSKAALLQRKPSN